MAEAVVRLRVDASGATRALNGVQQKTNQLQNSFNGLRNIIAATGIAVVGTQAVKTAANFEKLNVRLGLLTKASGTFARSQEIASDAQKAFGLSATEALEGITDITARLAPLNVGVEDIKSTFFGFNTAAKLAGASTIEASNAFRQLAQALGSGRLQGDEFRSISEQIPTLLAPVADELDTTVGELKKFASQGKITSEVVLRALRKIEKDGGASLKELIANDPTQVFKNLSNETENLSRAFGESLMPVVIPVVKALTEITEAATDFVNSPIGQTALIFSGIALAAKGAAVALIAAKAGFVAAGGGAVILAAALNALPFVALATAIGAVTTAIVKQIKQRKKLNDLVKEGEWQGFNVQSYSLNYLVVAGGGGGGTRYSLSGNEDGGGGGAGCYRASGFGPSPLQGSALSFTNVTQGSSYVVTVGAGGSGATFPGGNATSGTNSIFNACGSAPL